MVLSVSSLHHFPYEALSVCRAPLLQRHYPPSSLLWTHPTPSRLSVHFPLGYRTYLFPGFLRSGEEGLSSCLKCPCNRAVACTPPEESPVSVSLQDFLLSSLDSKQLDFRIQTPFEATMRSRLLRPGYSLTTPLQWLCQQTPDSSFPPCLLSKLRGPDFFPGRLAFFLLNISALSGRTKVRRSQARYPGFRSFQRLKTGSHRGHGGHRGKTGKG